MKLIIKFKTDRLELKVDSSTVVSDNSIAEENVDNEIPSNALAAANKSKNKKNTN